MMSERWDGCAPSHQEQSSQSFGAESDVSFAASDVTAGVTMADGRDSTENVGNGLLVTDGLHCRFQLARMYSGHRGDSPTVG